MAPGGCQVKYAQESHHPGYRPGSRGVGYGRIPVVPAQLTGERRHAGEDPGDRPPPELLSEPLGAQPPPRQLPHHRLCRDRNHQPLLRADDSQRRKDSPRPGLRDPVRRKPLGGAEGSTHRLEHDREPRRGNPDVLLREHRREPLPHSAEPPAFDRGGHLSAAIQGCLRDQRPGQRRGHGRRAPTGGRLPASDLLQRQQRHERIQLLPAAAEGVPQRIAERKAWSSATRRSSTPTGRSKEAAQGSPGCWPVGSPSTASSA